MKDELDAAISMLFILSNLADRKVQARIDNESEEQKEKG